MNPIPFARALSAAGFVLAVTTVPAGAQTAVQIDVSGLVRPVGPVPPQVEIQPLMGQPVPGLTGLEKDRFLRGGAEFNTPLPINEGLGPIFNDASCGNCHSGPALGGFSSFAVTRFGKMASGPDPFDPLASLGGSLQQLQTIDPVNCVEVVPPEADITASRITPHVFGSGLLEAVPDAQIQANAISPPAGISGIVRMVQPVEGGPMRAGRFGWKGGVATLLTFSADAGLNEMGLTNVFFGTENAPNGDMAALALCDSVPDPDDFPDALGVTKIERFTDFQKFLAPPPQTPRSGMTGETLFDTVGCGDCHVSDAYTTGVVESVALSNVEIKPYSDFLMHDMGALGDGIVDGPATEQEMTTRALWGLQVRSTVLHDGRSTGGTFADNMRDAIDEHDGEGDAARTAFQGLSVPDQDLVIDFLRSLGQAEFDFERDNDVDQFDWFFVEPALLGPGPVYTPDDFESINDIDQDGDFDLIDFGMLQRAFTG